MQSSYVNTKENEEGLGFPIAAISAASGIASAAPGVLDSVGGIVDSIGSIFGGGGKTYTNCGTRQQQAAAQFRKYLTPQDIQEFYRSGNTFTTMTGSTVNDLAFHFLGGDDCQVTSSRGRQWSNSLMQRVQQRQQEAKQAEQAKNNPIASAIGGTGGKGWVLPAAIGVGVLGIGGLIMAASGDDGPIYLPRRR